MADLPSSLGIEAVECVAEGGPSVTVRVTGRWRRRRPELRGQAVLVIETEAGRQRFPAMPEPPSLTGAAPGTWRMSFSVPAVLAPVLPGRTFLQLGGVMVPLPIGEVMIAQGPDPELLEARRARGSELAAESARRRAAELAESVKRLERELEQARDQSERLRDEIAERERRLRGAEQHAHAERALRADLEQELARRTRTAQQDLSALHGRVAELERELMRLRRAGDEARHLAAAAEARRAETERRLAERPAPAPPQPEPPPPPPPPSPPPPPPLPPPPPPETSPVPDVSRAGLSRRELALDQAARGESAHAAVLPRPAERTADRALLGVESAIARRRGERADPRVDDLRRELAAAREEIEAQRQRSARAYEAIELVRGELRQLRAPARPDPAPPEPSEPPVSDPAAPDPAAPDPAAADPVPPGPPAPEPQLRPSPPPARGPIQAEELNAALARLREQAPPEPQPPSLPDARSPGRSGQPWLEKPFRKLAGQDPSAAGRLLLALLPAQRAADPHAVAYDLVLSDLVCARVTVGSGPLHVELADSPRPLTEVDFQLVGDLAGVARLLVAGRLRRRVPSRRRARVRGDRRRLAALDHLLGARLTLGELIAAGVKFEPMLAFTLVANAVDPGWTAGERGTIAHRDPDAAAPDAYLHIRDAKPPLASSELPRGPVTTVVVCPADELIGVLAGREARIEGEDRPLGLVRQWLDRAQSG
jgi:hypothetical protein